MNATTIQGEMGRVREGDLTRDELLCYETVRERGSDGIHESELARCVDIWCEFFDNEEVATIYLEGRRGWYSFAKHCPYCTNENVYQVRDRKTGERNRRLLWRCRGCGKQYTVKVGTIMEDSAIPLRHWCYCEWLMTERKQGHGLAARLARDTGITYKSALLMITRMRQGGMNPVALKPRYNGLVLCA
jgi:transposase-like protein